MTLWFFEKSAIIIGSWVVLWAWTEYDRKHTNRKEQ